MEKVETKPSFAKFKPSKLHVPFSKPRSTNEFPFEFELRNRLVQEMGSSIEGSKTLTTQTSTPKFMEEVAIEVMQAQKAIELFQIMAIVSLNMGNLNLEVSSLKNRLATWEKEKAVL